MKHDKFIERNKRNGNHFKASKFTNELGEEYVLYTNGITVLITGDETDWEMQPLFHPNFNIWSAEELYKLGKALRTALIANNLVGENVGK